MSSCGIKSSDWSLSPSFENLKFKAKPRAGRSTLKAGSPPKEISDMISEISTSPLRQKRKDSPTSSKGSSIGSLWTVELACLQQAGSAYEVAISLRCINDLLYEIDPPDRIRFCKHDFDEAIKILSNRVSLLYGDLPAQIAAIYRDFFNQDCFRKLPSILIEEIMMYLPLDEFFPVLIVSKEWNKFASSDEVWQVFYRYKFLRTNPNTMPASISGGYLSAFRSRLQDPQIGDKVEVAWRGKFRLEALDVYQGLAWWVAEVVDKHTTQGKYKIRYPGWESGWDEWVSKSRLRWAVDKDYTSKLDTHDTVELWCCGANVPGAWLESRIKKVRGERYCVDKALATGHIWVERERLRPVKKASKVDAIVRMRAAEEQDLPSQADPRRSLLQTVSSTISRGFIARFRAAPAAAGVAGGDGDGDGDEIRVAAAGCTIM